MSLTGTQLSGLQPKSHAEITRDFFSHLQIKNPNITLDDAILRFEQASEDSLDEFAKKRLRTGDSYRKVYKRFWFTQRTVQESSVADK
tara:strand:- start:354 stop:617 length:264 start_codon:yes stop_codon:yes gene_type:complete